MRNNSTAKICREIHQEHHDSVMKIQATTGGPRSKEQAGEENKQVDCTLLLIAARLNN